MIGTGGEQDPFKYLNVKVLIKTFKLIPKVTIFRGCPLMTPFQGGVIYSIHLGFTAHQDYFTHFEPSQSLDRAKMGDP